MGLPLRVFVICCSLAVVGGLPLKLDTAHAGRSLDKPLSKFEEAVQRPFKKLEDALKPDEETRKQWKGGYKSTKKTTKNGDDSNKGVKQASSQFRRALKDNMKAPWKAPKETRVLWQDTLHGRKLVKHWKGAVASACLWLMFTALFGFFYRSSYASGDLKFVSSFASEDWSTGLCSCQTWMSRPSIFCMSWWCPSVRWSQTVAMTQIAGFWEAFICFNLSNLIAVIPLVGSPFAAALDTYDRIILRKKLGMPAAGCAVSTRDCCLFMCCSTCMIAQEAYHVEELAASQVP